MMTVLYFIPGVCAFLLIVGLIVYSHVRLELKVNYLFALLNNGLNSLMPLRTDQTPARPRSPDDSYIASMTSFGDRLFVVDQVIKSIINQNHPPDGIHLYLADSVARTDLPSSLLALEAHGLTLHFVEDIGSYKKLIFALRDHPGRRIITFDDDLAYPPQAASCLLRYAQRFPGCVVANWAREIRFLFGRPLPIRMGRLLTPPRLEWNIEQHAHMPSPSLRTYAYGASGIFYPPGAFDDRVFDLDLMRRVCPSEDDVWFKAMTILNGVATVETNLGFNPQQHCILGSQLSALRHVNHGGRQNVAQLQNAFQTFDLYARIRSAERAEKQER